MYIDEKNSSPPESTRNKNFKAPGGKEILLTNDVIDVSEKKITECSDSIEETKKNIIEYVDNSVLKIKDSVEQRNNSKNDEHITDVKMDKNLSVLFEIYGK